MVVEREAAAQSPEQARDNATHSTSATVRQPRPFGYVIGDLLSQHVLLQNAGADFDLAELPAARRVGVWFERRAAKIERASDGRRWLRVDYQVINAPQKLANVSLPAWQIQSKAGGAPLAVPAWPVSIAPLTPESAFVTGGLGELRPDRPAPVIATAPVRRQLIITLTALVITLGAWLAWLRWRNGYASAHQPFARALREIQGLDATAPQAWQALHRAFDRTADRAVQVDMLPALFQRAPHLLPVRSDIERFFAESSELFFGAGRRDGGFSVLTLCSELRRIEKQHEP
jgi:mxaA protein